jgi:hypothetical protein
VIKKIIDNGKEKYVIDGNDFLEFYGFLYVFKMGDAFPPRTIKEKKRLGIIIKNMERIINNKEN